MKSYFVHNGPVSLHVLEKGEASPSMPSLLVIGGLWEPAERAIPLLTHLSAHVIAFSFRGRGLSSTPHNGYSLADHLSDIQTVVKHCGLENYSVLGFSRSASYALGWSLQHQEQMKQLILVDQPPVHSGLTAEAVDYWSELIYLEVPVLNYIRKAALEGLRRDAQEVEFTPQLEHLQLPVTLFAGRNREAVIPSDLPADRITKYTDHLSSCRVVEFPGAGHMIPDEEQAKYIAEVALCLQEV